MREVNNNTANSNNVNFKGVRPRQENVQPDVISSIDAKEITDLGKMPSEVIGRSQVAKASSQKDVEFMMKNPEKAEDLNRWFNYLVETKGLSYEDACMVLGAAAEEFYGA